MLAMSLIAKPSSDVPAQIAQEGAVPRRPLDTWLQNVRRIRAAASTEYIPNIVSRAIAS